MFQNHAQELSRVRECLQMLLSSQPARDSLPARNIHLGFDVCHENVAFALKYYLWKFS